MNTYYIMDGNEPRGPYTMGQLRSMWNAGQITRETLYCEEGLQEWFPIHMIQEQIEPEEQATAHYHAANAKKEESILGTLVKFILILFGCLIAVGAIITFLGAISSSDQSGGAREIRMTAEIETEISNAIETYKKAGVITKIESYQNDQAWLYVSDRFNKMTFDDKRILAAAVYTYHHKRSGAQFLVIKDAYNNKSIGHYSPTSGFTLD